MCYYLQLQKYETYSKLFGKTAGIINGNVNIPDGRRRILPQLLLVMDNIISSRTTGALVNYYTTPF